MSISRQLNPVRSASLQFSTFSKPFIFGCCLFLVSFPSLAASEKLSLEEAQRLALTLSRQLVAQDFALTASRESAVLAGQRPDPVLTMGIDNLPVSGQDSWSLSRDFMTMRRIGITQELTNSDKRQLRAERYHRAADKTLAEKEITVAAIKSNTAVAWFDLYYAQENLKIIEEQAVQTKAETSALESEYRTGRGNQADILLARSAEILLQDRRSEAQRRVLNAETMLRRWTGDGVSMSLSERPAIDHLTLLSDGRTATNFASQMLHHPQIISLSRQVNIAEADAKIARAEKKSDWSVELMLQQRGANYSKMISIGVSRPLQWDQKQRQDRELSSKLALIEQAKAERDEALHVHLAEIQTLVAEWQNDRERLLRFEQELLPLAKQRSLASFAAYRGGKTSLTELLGASRNEIDLRQQALQLEAEIARLWAQLNFLFPTDAQQSFSSRVIAKDAP